MKDESFWELQRVLSAEFSKHVLGHPEIDEQIPDGAQVIFNLENNPEFNDWALRVARAQCEPNQSMVIVKIKGLAPVPASRLINPELVRASQK